jgi:hypothetical protein
MAWNSRIFAAFVKEACLHMDVDRHISCQNAVRAVDRAVRCSAPLSLPVTDFIMWSGELRTRNWRKGTRLSLEQRRGSQTAVATMFCWADSRPDVCWLRSAVAPALNPSARYQTATGFLGGGCTPRAVNFRPSVRLSVCSRSFLR